MNGSARAPVQFWIVGIVATLWNAFLAFDYVMVQTNNEAYMAQFPQECRDFFASFPAWMETGWAIGVWGGLVGSLLLLARSRHAIPIFALSLVGQLVATFYTWGLTTPPASMRNAAMVAMYVAICVIALGLFLYARRMRANRVLR